MSNYRKTMGQAIREMYPINEDNMDLMRKAAGGAVQTVKMKDGKLKMDSFTASAIMQVYDKVNPANQKKMAVMINKGTKDGMLKLQSFAMKRVKSGYGEEVEEEAELDEDFSVEVPKQKIAGKTYGGGATVIVKAKTASQAIKMVAKRLGVDVNLLKTGKVVKEEVGLDEASKLPPHLAKFFDKDGNLKKDAADRIAKGKEKLNWKDVTPKGYGPNEEVELDEANFEIKNGKIHISKKDYAKKPKEYKGKRAGKPTLIALDPKTGGTTSFEVVLEEAELDEENVKYKVTNDRFGVWTGMADSEEDAKEKALSKWGVAGNSEFTANTTAEKEEAVLDEARQLKDPKKEVMVSKGGKVIVIDKKDQDKYLKKGWELAEEVGLDESTKEYAKSLANIADKAKKDNITDKDLETLVKLAALMKKEEVELDEFTVSDVEIAMKKKYGKVDKEAIEKLKKVQHMGNVDRNALVKVGHGKLHVESVDLDEANVAKFSDDVLKSRLKQQRDLLKTRGDSPATQSEIKRLEKEMKKRGLKEDVDLDEIKKGTRAELIALNKELTAAKKKKDKEKVAALQKELDALLKSGKGKKIGPDWMHNEEVDLDEGKMSEGWKMRYLHQLIKDKKSAEEIAKIMKLDVKTIKVLMSSYHPEDVEEGAAADARKAMRKDPDFSRKDSADDDDSATDDDVKAASKNIMMQLRKAISLKGRFDVEFGDKKKFKVPVKMALAVTQKYNSLKKPADKEKFQAQIAKSYKDMLKTLKAGYHGEQKESILDRIDRKIKENKEILEASNRWELAGKKFSLVNDKGTYILVSQGTGKETKLKAKTPQEATQELVKKGYKES